MPALTLPLSASPCTDFGELHLQFLYAHVVVYSYLREQLLPMPPVTSYVGKQDEKERTQGYKKKLRE